VGVLRLLLKKPKNNEKSPTKDFIEGGRAILQLSWYLPGAEPDEAPNKVQWFHLSSINQLSWACSILELDLDPDRHERREAASVGQVALRAAVGSDAHDASHEGVFESWRISLLPVAFVGSNLAMTCNYRVYTIIDSDDVCLDFVPAQVRVHALGDESTCWPGLAAVEALLDEQRRRARVAAPGGAPPRKRARDKKKESDVPDIAPAILMAILDGDCGDADVECEGLPDWAVAHEVLVADLDGAVEVDAGEVEIDVAPGTSDASDEDCTKQTWGEINMAIGV
jgi:hypothetical protein